jgi:hypothetical protein
MPTALNQTKRIALWAIPTVFVLGGAAFGAKMLMPAPAGLDYALTRPSELGTFTATVTPATDPIMIEQPQTWTVEIAMADGSTPGLADIAVDGGMPQHGHGLPSEPRVTRHLGDGKFEVEGMLFSMSGWWVVNVHVATPLGPDKATFNFEL